MKFCNSKLQPITDTDVLKTANHCKISCIRSHCLTRITMNAIPDALVFSTIANLQLNLQTTFFNNDPGTQYPNRITLRLRVIETAAVTHVTPASPTTPPIHDPRKFILETIDKTSDAIIIAFPLRSRNEGMTNCCNFVNHLQNSYCGNLVR